MTVAVPIVLLAVGAIAAMAIAAYTLRAYPRVAFAAWVITLFFVPVWVGATAGVFWAAITVLTVLLIVVNWSLVPLRAADLWIAAFVVLTIGLYALGFVSLAAMTIAIIEWIVPYIWGRVALARLDVGWVTATIAVVAVVAAALAIVEFTSGWNPFVLIPGAGEAYDTWSPLQYRGGVIRAEGAFGHSIALGASLAMSVAFVIATRWRLAPKILAVSVVSTGAILTLSRAGIITLTLTLILSTFLLPGVSRWFRMTFAVTAGVAVVLLMPVLDTLFGTADDDLAVSGDYRGDLLVLLSQVEMFGSPGDWQSRVVGDQYLGYFARSIDNALLLILLRVGWVPTALLIGALICAAIAALRRKTRNPAALAVVGQLPSLVVVALITQYGMYLWFCIGLAVAWASSLTGHPLQASFRWTDTDTRTAEMRR
jgi:hypothetical protein